MGDDAAEDYRRAMYGAANFAWANRQAMTQAVRRAFRELFGTAEESVELVYDVCHNIAKEETHEVDGERKDLLVHRKARRGPSPPDTRRSPAYRDAGQPVLLPGSMGTHSYVLAGGERSMELSFGSTAHGAGRLKSRTQAKKDYTAGDLKQRLRGEGVYVKARSGATVAEEAPGAYKDVDEVVRVSDRLGIGTKVARMRPWRTSRGKLPHPTPSALRASVSSHGRSAPPP
ncbi:RtcB family protein, partial [Halomarina halobia]|uniref:RtcB family protein n=1 Tax=Halomarina halobia TaxID=3033386 RepID=UPI00360779A3